MRIFSRRRVPVVRREEALALDRTLPGHTGEILIKRSSARRTLALRVSESGQAIVNAPLGLSLAKIEAFLGQHATWLATHLARAQHAGFTWQDGAALPWQGGYLTLALAPPGTRPPVRLEGGTLHCTGAGETISALVSHWYRRQSRLLLSERLAFHAGRMGRLVPPLRISDARTRWGSLSSRGVVSLNWRLIKASPEEMDYVICHELAHFCQRNHSAAFWDEVERFFPDWQAARQALRKSGQEYFLF